MADGIKRANTADIGKGKSPGSAVDERLEPLEEFRGRSESWMKEITSQVARLASRNEEDDRRRKNLDKRLGDIEQRIQSLLTLTEMLSMGSNPFVASGAPAAAAPAPAPERAPPAVTPPVPATPPTPPAPPQAAMPSPAAQAAMPPDEDDEGEAVVAAPVAPPRAAAPATAAPPAPAPHHERPKPERTPPDGTAPRRANGDPSRHASYFSDLLASAPAPRAGPTAPQGGASSEVPADPSEISATPRTAADHTVERLVLLEWAELLASRLPRGHIQGFLRRYEEAGWIVPGTADRVLALASGLEVGHHDPPTAQDLHHLHVRSLVLLSFLDGRAIPPSEVLEVLQTARAATHGAWADDIR